MPHPTNPALAAADWPLAHRPGFLARRLHQIHVALFGARCADFDVTPVQYSLLSALAARGRCDQTTLAGDVALDRTTTTGALKRLEARGLVARTASSRDRRARDCGLTAPGRRMLAAMARPARAAHDETLACLSAEERTTWLALTERIVAAAGPAGT